MGGVRGEAHYLFLLAPTFIAKQLKGARAGDGAPSFLSFRTK